MQQELTAQSRECCDPRTPKSQWHIINWGIWEPQEQIPVPGQRGTHLQTDCANKMLFKCLESQVDGCFYKALKLPRHRKEQPKPWHCSCSDSSLPRAFMESQGILRRVPGQLLDSLCFCWSCGLWQILLKVLTPHCLVFHSTWQAVLGSAQWSCCWDQPHLGDISNFHRSFNCLRLHNHYHAHY